MRTLPQALAGLSPVAAGFLCLFLQACTTEGGIVDAGLAGGGLTFADIGTPCTCDLVDGPNGITCSRNPTNTCAKSSLTCVIGAPGFASYAGHPLFEYNLFNAQYTTDAGAQQIQGECTVVANPLDSVAVPPGTALLVLSNGFKVLKRLCLTDTECGRPGWVCDAPFFDRAGIDTGTTAREIPLQTKICKPACRADFPDCLRTTACTLGRPGCYRSPVNEGAPPDLGIYVGDFFGTRSCNITTGTCGATASRSTIALNGSPCLSNADCKNGDLCVSEYWWSNFTDGYGFCTSPGCDPAAAPGAAGSCDPTQGLTCQVAFEHGMCFPDCRAGTLCDLGSRCGVLATDPANGTAAGWSKNECIPCDLAGSCP